MESQLPRVCQESLALTTRDIPFTPVSSFWEQRDSVHLVILEGGMRWMAGVWGGVTVQHFKGVSPHQWSPHIQESRDTSQKEREQGQ